ncbi:uncharacterized protein [Clytia hemisphaerica]|uniref:uncharacterized protein isoform X3 n=1 Tax=Clytia hemisphaerica TaxID=252671 RepID=UPI0034D4ECA4
MPIKNEGLIMEPKWRIISLSLMAVTLVLLVAATMSTNWREDHEGRIDVFITHGLWRICRDIKFGATLDHKCMASLANNAPDWFQTVRAFMLLTCLVVLIAFAYAVKLIYQLPVIKHRNQKASVSLALPAILMFVAAVTGLIGVTTFSVATHMDQGLYFPESLPPTWGNSWAMVWAKRNSLPSDRPEEKAMEMTYGYSYALGWLGVLSTTASFVVNLVASGKQ